MVLNRCGNNILWVLFGKCSIKVLCGVLDLIMLLFVRDFIVVCVVCGVMFSRVVMFL